jgi:GT2 family glycosyltransferase
VSTGLLSSADRPAEPGGLRTVTAAVINFNGRNLLPATLAALRAVERPALEIVVVDDGSTDGSVAWLREHHPDVRLIALPENGGKPSRARNAALREAHTRYVLLLDNDVVVEPGCPAALLHAMTTNAAVLGCSPRLLYANDAGRIYYDGSDLHFLCVSTNSARGRFVGEGHRARRSTIPGGNVLIDRHAAIALGGFDEGYDFGWGEDAELFVRGWIAGSPSLHVAEAVATHVERERGAQRAEAQIYNRYRMLLTMFQHRTLVLLAPPLVLFELPLAAMSLAQGLGAAQLRSIRRILAEFGELRRRRARIQAVRRISDGKILNSGDLRPTGALNRSRWVAAGTRVLELAVTPYWKLVVQPLLGGRRREPADRAAAARTVDESATSGSRA